MENSTTKFTVGQLFSRMTLYSMNGDFKVIIHDLNRFEPDTFEFEISTGWEGWHKVPKNYKEFAQRDVFSVHVNDSALRIYVD